MTHKYVFKKQIQKFKKYLNNSAKNKLIILALSTLILLSFAPILSQVTSKVSAADNDNCFYSRQVISVSPPQSELRPRPTVSENFSLSVADYPIWDNESLKLNLSLKYDLTNPNLPGDCLDTERFFVRFDLYSAFRGWYNAGSEPGTDIIASIERTGTDPNRPTQRLVKGTLSLSNINEALNSAARSVVKGSTIANPTKARAVVVYQSANDGVITGFGGVKEFSIAPCLQPTVTDPNNPAFCKPHTQANIDDNNDTTIGNADDIPLEGLRLTLNTGVSDKSLVPNKVPAIAGGYGNFIRIYKGQPFSVTTYVAMTGPTGKNLKIPGSKATFNIKKSSLISKKDFLNLGTGFTPAVSNSNDTFGCYKGDIDSNYWVWKNDSYAYKYCNFAQSFSDNQIALSTAKDSLKTFEVQLGDKLDALKADKIVKCKDGTCDSVYNEVNVDVFYTLDKTFGSDQTSISLTDFVFPAGGLYNRIREAVIAGNNLQITTHPKDKQLKFYIQIYENETDWKAHINDELPAGLPAYTSSEVGSGVKPTSGNSLYEFVVKVISIIVTWLQSVIYRIFAFVLVPIINALLQVRPYKDAFVNVIYPGWLILRNIANIFFIISLLVVGLRILFQQAGSSTAVSFIRTLLIMALLVNFSLVIAQGIIGIADTVQSQFLPANTRVIEALGAKLMVEPLQNFRAEVTNNENANFDVDTAAIGLSDTVKPIILLILSVASFFAFAAIAAFLLVRLVMLWILYMLSPLAYVGYVMQLTKQFADQWWSEFTKWAVITPLLVFFLNIGALMAVSFSTGSSKLDIFNKEGTFTGDVVIGSLTILTHFVVLAFIFGGMMIATKLGGKAGKTIVDYAKKGFKNTFKKPAQAGVALGRLAQTGSDALSEKLPSEQAKLLNAITHPLQFGKNVKKAWIDEPGEKRKKKVAERLGDIPFFTKTEKKGDLLKEHRKTAKEEEYYDMDAGKLADTLENNIKKQEGKKAGGAIMALAKDKNFDEILRGVGAVTGKEYSGAAGLNSAVDDIKGSMGWSEAEALAFKTHLSDQAKKDKKKSHFAGGAGYNKISKKDEALKVGEDGQFDKGTGPDDKESDYSKWIEDQVSGRMKMSVSEDLKNTGIDSMVKKGVGGAVEDFSDVQYGVFAKANIDQMQDAETRKRFVTSDNYAKMKEAYDKTLGKDRFGNDKDPTAFLEKINEYNRKNGLDEITADSTRFLAIKKLFTPPDGKNNGGDGQGGNGGGNGGGTPRTPIGGVGRKADGTARSAPSTADRNRAAREAAEAAEAARSNEPSTPAAPTASSKEDDRISRLTPKFEATDRSANRQTPTAGGGSAPAVKALDVKAIESVKTTDINLEDKNKPSIVVEKVSETPQLVIEKENPKPQDTEPKPQVVVNQVSMADRNAPIQSRADKAQLENAQIVNDVAKFGSSGAYPVDGSNNTIIGDPSLVNNQNSNTVQKVGYAESNIPPEPPTTDSVKKGPTVVRGFAPIASVVPRPNVDTQNLKENILQENPLSKPVRPDVPNTPENLDLPDKLDKSVTSEPPSIMEKPEAPPETNKPLDENK